MVMATLSELLKEIRTLPKGNIYRKVISGKEYFYHQYFEHGKRYSQIVSGDRLNDLREKIGRRKELERQIAEKSARNVTISKNAEELTGYLMSGTRVVASFGKGVMTDIDEVLAPLVIKRTHSLESFLKLRLLDMSRTNARLLKKVLNIHVEEDYKTALYAYALSVYDNYWFKPKHSKLTYHDLNLDDDALFETSLKGEANVFFQKARLSPELTTPGSLEKGWRYIDNEWWLYKSEDPVQAFSEIFSSRFAVLIGVPSVEYELDEQYVRCKNFSKDTNFEPMASLAGDNEEYEHIFSILVNIDERLASEYIKLIFFDSVVNNIDRHNENLGFLRDTNDGRIISLAPNFDNNLSLVATTGYLNDEPKKDGFIKTFVDFLKKNEKAKALFQSIDFKDISVEEVEQIVNSIPIQVPHKSAIAPAIMARYSYLKNPFNK